MSYPGVFLLVFALLAPAAASQLPASMPAGEAAQQFQALMEEYYRAYAREDLDAMAAVWHPRGPARGSGDFFAHEFRLYDAEFEGIRLSDVAVDAGGGRAKAVIDLRVVAATGGHARRQRRVRDVTFLPHDGRWRLWNETTAGRSLASRALSIPTEQLDAALAGDPELLSDDAMTGLGTEAILLRTRGEAGESMRATELRLRIAREVGQEAVMADCLAQLGLQHQLSGRYAEARAAFAEARGMVERTGTPRELAFADMNLAAIEYLEGRYQGAIEGYERALSGFDPEEDRASAAGVHHSIGNALYMLGEYEQALESYGRATRLGEEVGSPVSVGAARLAAALVHKELGNYAEAAAAYRGAAAAGDAVAEHPDHATVARALQGLGDVQRLQGDFAAALESLDASLARWEKTPDVPGRTAALFATGQVHALLRNFARALEWYGKALEADRAIGDEPGVARDLGGRGGAHLAMGQVETAQAEYEESLALREKLEDRRGVTWILVHLAALHGRHGRPDEAIRIGQRAVGEAGSLGDRGALATAWALIAESQLSGGDLDAAIVSAARAADLARQVGQFDVLTCAETVAGRAHARAGRTADALASLEEAVAALGQVPSGPAADVFFDDHRAPYVALVDLLAGQGRASEAFAWFERGRQHLLGVMLGEGGVLVAKNLTGAEREEELRLLRAARSARVKLQREEQRERPDEARQARLRQEMASLAAARAALGERINLAHPALRALRAQGDVTEALSNPSLLQPGEAAIAYSIGESALHVFVLAAPRATEEGRGGPRVEVATVEVAAADLGTRVARFREAILSRDPAADALGADLHRLLIAPARPWLPPSPRLLVIPDAFLWGVPFEALRSPAGRYLVEDAAVSYIPSMWSASLYRGAAPLAASPHLAALAAPIVPPSIEERLALALPGGKTTKRTTGAAEARAIAALFPAASRLFTGGNATAERLAGAVTEGGVVHIASLALANDASPFYSCLLLSPAAANDPAAGLVEAADLMSWNLPGGLAVLSHADAMQPRPAGEALTAISWSFLVAGTPALAISRWTPPAQARVDPLVRGFYRELLRPPAKGRPRPSPAAALQRAARRLLAAPATRHPWFWTRMMVLGS